MDGWISEKRRLEDTDMASAPSMITYHSSGHWPWYARLWPLLPRLEPGMVGKPTDRNHQGNQQKSSSRVSVRLTNRAALPFLSVSQDLLLKFTSNLIIYPPSQTR